MLSERDLSKNEGCLASAPSFFILFALCTSIYLSSSVNLYAALIIALLFTAALILLMTKEIVPDFFKVFFVVLAAAALLSFASLMRVNSYAVPENAYGARTRVELPSGISSRRAHVERLIDERLMPRSAAYVSAFTTGRRDREETALHRKAGTSHLLAVSGMHISLITAILYMFLPVNVISAVVVSGCMWLYLLIAGLPVGGVRAVLMFSVLFISSACGRKKYTLNSLCVAAVIMLLVNPLNFYNLGWRLSVLCSLFLSSCSYLHGIFGAIVSSAAVWFITLPLCAASFGAVPAAGLVLNIFAIPAFAFIFPATLLLALPPLLQLPGACFCANLSETMLFYFDTFLEKGASLIPYSVAADKILSAGAVFIFFFSLCTYCRTGTTRSVCLALALCFIFI